MCSFLNGVASFKKKSLTVAIIVFIRCICLCVHDTRKSTYTYFIAYEMFAVSFQCCKSSVNLTHIAIKRVWRKIVLQTAWWSTLFFFILFFVENSTNKWLIMRSWPFYHNKSMQMQSLKTMNFNKEYTNNHKNVKVPLLKRNDRIINIQWTAKHFPQISVTFLTYQRILLLDSKPMRSKMSIECLTNLTNQHEWTWACACKMNPTTNKQLEVSLNSMSNGLKLWSMFEVWSDYFAKRCFKSVPFV